MNSHSDSLHDLLVVL